ncbi:MAG: conjugal transfer protein TraO [Alistipes sp.]|nr:conjugal transfer protein TraO [Candidatus Alistipes equi]
MGIKRQIALLVVILFHLSLFGEEILSGEVSLDTSLALRPKRAGVGWDFSLGVSKSYMHQMRLYIGVKYSCANLKYAKGNIPVREIGGCALWFIPLTRNLSGKFFLEAAAGIHIGYSKVNNGNKELWDGSRVKKSKGLVVSFEILSSVRVKLKKRLSPYLSLGVTYAPVYVTNRCSPTIKLGTLILINKPSKIKKL